MTGGHSTRRAVDLEGVDRQFRQVAERREAGAEIIDAMVIPMARIARSWILV